MPPFSPSALKKAKRAGAAINALTALSAYLGGKAALRLVMTPFPIEFTENQQEFLASAKQETLSLEKHQIRSYHWQPNEQNGQSVLLLHGWSSRSTRWMPLANNLLREGFEVLAFDAPAHGFSNGKYLNVDLYARTLKAFLLEKPMLDAIVGHSIGASAAVYGMGNYGAPRPKKMALLAGFADSQRVMLDFSELFGFSPKTVEAMDSAILKKFGVRMADFAIPKHLQKLQDIQGLVIHDEEDDVAPFLEGKQLAEVWGNAQFVATHGQGHSLYGKKVRKVLVDFLKQ